MTGDSTVAEIEALGGSALGIEVNVADHEVVSAMVARVLQDWGRVDVLVANAGGGGYAHYGAAKAAIAHYTRYLAQDLGPFGITANFIAPGVIATGRIMATVIPGSSQSNRDRSESVALRRLGTVEDCAKVVEFLATDLSDYVTGAVIPIDGGLVRG
jgi:NAD(P)-dependent dehydrogenase (short-subunit alcohol dehydrogenase family)